MDDIVQGSGLRADPAAKGDSEMAPISKIGIIGAGQMGGGIAHVVALSGYDVVMHDIVKEKVDAALAIIDKNLARQVASGKISDEERKKALSRITYAETLQGLGDADLVIEAATEDETVKRKIFVALCPFIKPDAIVATNTSSISITRLAAATDRPERFIGLHFMNPGAGDGAGRDDPRYRHRGRHLRPHQGFRRVARQDGRRVGGFPRLHGQPHPAADDQRGGVHAV